MSGPVRILEDGTRVYANGVKYKPVSKEKRKHRVRKPEHPRAVRWHGLWLILPELLDERARVLPETRPDTDAYEHWLKGRGCKCEVCSRPESKKWKEKGAVARHEGQSSYRP